MSHRTLFFCLAALTSAGLALTPEAAAQPAGSGAAQDPPAPQPPPATPTPAATPPAAQPAPGPAPTPTPAPAPTTAQPAPAAPAPAPAPGAPAPRRRQPPAAPAPYPGYAPYPYPYPPYPYPYPPRGYGYPPGYGNSRYPPGYVPNYNYGVPPLPPPRVLPYREGQPKPDGYSLDTRVRRPLVIAGSVTFGATYLISAAVAAGFQDDVAGEQMLPLFIPVAGPFVAIGTADPSPFGTFALIADGLAQASGVAMFIAGFVDKEKIWLRDNVTLRITPMAGPTQAGMAMTMEY